MDIYMKTFKNLHCYWIVYPDYLTVKPRLALDWEKADYHSLGPESVWLLHIMHLLAAAATVLSSCRGLWLTGHVTYSVAALGFKELVQEVPHSGPEESGDKRTRGRESMLLTRMLSKAMVRVGAAPALRSLVQGFGSRGQNPLFPGLCRALLLKRRVTVEQGKDRKLASVPQCLSENLWKDELHNTKHLPFPGN